LFVLRINRLTTKWQSQTLRIDPHASLPFTHPGVSHA
jgi:hypothetical protein